MARDEVLQIMGPALDIEPHDALLLCVKIAAGEVAYCTMRVSELDVDVIARPQTDVTRNGDGSYTEHKEGPERLNLWITTRQTCLERLAKFSKMALDAGIAQRTLELAEGQGSQLAFAMKSMFDELQLTEEQLELAPDVIHKHLTIMEASSTAALEVFRHSGKDTYE